MRPIRPTGAVWPHVPLVPLVSGPPQGTSPVPSMPSVRYTEGPDRPRAAGGAPKRKSVLLAIYENVRAELYEMPEMGAAARALEIRTRMAKKAAAFLTKHASDLAQELEAFSRPAAFDLEVISALGGLVQAGLVGAASSLEEIRRGGQQPQSDLASVEMSLVGSSSLFDAAVQGNQGACWDLAFLSREINTGAAHHLAILANYWGLPPDVGTQRVRDFRISGAVTIQARNIINQCISFTDMQQTGETDIRAVRTLKAFAEGGEPRGVFALRRLKHHLERREVEKNPGMLEEVHETLEQLDTGYLKQAAFRGDRLAGQALQYLYFNRYDLPIMGVLGSPQIWATAVDIEDSYHDAYQSIYGLLDFDDPGEDLRAFLAILRTELQVTRLEEREEDPNNWLHTVLFLQELVLTCDCQEAFDILRAEACRDGVDEEILNVWVTIAKEGKRQDEAVHLLLREALGRGGHSGHAADLLRQLSGIPALQAYTDQAIQILAAARRPNFFHASPSPVS